MANIGSVTELVDSILRRAVEARASDVHLEPGETTLRIRFRVDSVLRDVDQAPAALAPNIATRLKVLAGLLTYRTDIPQEGSIPPGSAPIDGEVRVSSFPTVRGERIVLRLLDNAHRFLNLAELGHDPALIARIERRLAQPQGCILACGPAGSGKTTTLYAMLAHLRESRPDASIVAVEDPVEIRLDGVTQVQVEPARGLTYAVALRSLLRQDPQVLMIGEIRDAEVAAIAIEAALTGHLLLASMHSGSAAETVLRLLEMGVPPYQVTSTIAGVLSQRLVRTLDSGGNLLGRCAIGHFVEMSPELRRAILAGGDAESLAASYTLSGSLIDDGRRLLRENRTTPDELRRVLGESESL